MLPAGDPRNDEPDAIRTTHFIHDILGNVIAETAGGGATGSTGTVREYIWLYDTEIAPTLTSRREVDRPLAVVDAVNTMSPRLWFVHVDHLNRPKKMTDATKDSVWDVEWAPWGAPHAITGTATLDARFPGQWFQLEAGLHYNWHRHYDPSLGRYTQSDPLGLVDGPSLFAYAGNAPLQSVDKYGLMSSTESSSQKNTQVCLKDTCQKCLQACDRGKFAVEQFCKTTPMPPQAKALCWAATYAGVAACKGYCYNNHCLDVPL